MKRRKFLIILLLFTVMLLLFGCSAEDSKGMGVETGDNNVTVETTRKIYYTVSYTIDTEDLGEINSSINSKVNELNGYVSNSSQNGNYANYVYKVPTKSLNTFLDFVDSFGENVSEKNVQSTDITSTYSQLDARKEILEASRVAYLKLLNEKNLSISSIIELQNKIDDIDSELLNLNNQLSKYDNLVEYSTVTITYNQKDANEGFCVEYGNYLFGLLKLVFYIFMYTLPFTSIAGIVLLVMFLIKKRKMKLIKNEE